MAGEGKGWISLYRSIQDHWLWQERPFDKARAWIDLLLLANHKENKILLGNELIAVDKGSFITSQAKLMERWGWGNTKVRNFLNLLKVDNMIEYSGSKYTLIKINNYEMYQKQTGINPAVPMDSENVQIDSKSTTNREQTDSKLRANTNNNDNNDNNDNKYINNKEEINPMEVYQNNIYPMPGVIEIEGIKDWSNTLGNELVVQAIEIAAKKNVRNWRYIERILMDWNKNGIKTLDQAKAYSENRKKGGQKENDRDRTDNTKDEVKYNFSRFGG
ncbi:DnaD domain protein [Clostridium botulinum]|nr:DnaD domain protein [Clostridium botulinum]